MATSMAIQFEVAADVNEVGWITPGELTPLGPWYVMKPVELQKAIFWSAGILIWSHVGGHFVRRISRG